MDHRFESQETSHPSCTMTSVQAEVGHLTSLSLFPHLENGGCETCPLYSTGPCDCFRDNEIISQADSDSHKV